MGMTTFFSIAFYTATLSVIAYIHYLMGKARGREESAKVAKDYYENLLHAETEEAFTKGFNKGRYEGYNDGKREAEIVAHNKEILRKAGILK